jgi:hypothetical protein
VSSPGLRSVVPGAAAVVAACLILGAVALQQAQAGSDAACAALVLDDWLEDGAVGQSYRPGCYREAIRSLPEDLRAYSSAPEDIERAMRGAPFGVVTATIPNPTDPPRGGHRPATS